MEKNLHLVVQEIATDDLISRLILAKLASLNLPFKSDLLFLTAWHFKQVNLMLESHWFPLGFVTEKNKLRGRFDDFFWGSEGEIVETANNTKCYWLKGK